MTTTPVRPSQPPAPIDLRDTSGQASAAPSNQVTTQGTNPEVRDELVRGYQSPVLMVLDNSRGRNRLRDVIKGRVKSRMKDLISQGDMVGKKGKDLVTVPIPQIDRSRFTLGGGDGQGGLGQGDGEVGDAADGSGQPQPGDGAGKAGKDVGQHMLEAEVTFDELVDMLAEEIELRDLKEKPGGQIESTKYKTRNIRKVGPRGQLNYERSFREAIMRTSGEGTYHPDEPVVIQPPDFRFRGFEAVPSPTSNAVIIYMLDVSGSMGEEQKEIVRIQAHCTSALIRKQHPGVQERFIIHDAVAKEVDRETFFRTRESGGTMISSAYDLAAKMIEQDYSPTTWNIYPFHFCDGDNWSLDDNEKCEKLLREKLLPASNMFGYAQVKSPHGSGQFIDFLADRFEGNDVLVRSKIEDRSQILDSIKTFLGKK